MQNSNLTAMRPNQSLKLTEVADRDFHCLSCPMKKSMNNSVPDYYNELFCRRSLAPVRYTAAFE
jgi:hypothetical protein